LAKSPFILFRGPCAGGYRPNIIARLCSYSIEQEDVMDFEYFCLSRERVGMTIAFYEVYLDIDV